MLSLQWTSRDWIKLCLNKICIWFIRQTNRSRIWCAMIPTSTVSQSIKIGLRLTGIWPNSSIFFRFFWTIVMATGLIFQYQYLLNHFSTSEDLSNFLDGLSTTLPYNLLLLKLIILWRNNRYVFLTFLFIRER